MATFEDVHVVGKDEDKSHKDLNEPHFFWIYLDLSAQPPPEWVEIFEGNTKRPRRDFVPELFSNISIKETVIVFRASKGESQRAIDRLSDEYLPWVNQRYRESLKEQEEQQREEQDFLDSLDT